jgi:ParB-like chromosome segregation protein Spo0J
MNPLVIDSAEQFEAINRAPVTINSRSTGGKILVPCMSTMLVRTELVVANTYNPNAVSPDKMELLRTSIIDNGWCFPIVTIWDSELRQFVIVDGFHRNLIGSKDWLDVDYIPIVVLTHTMAQRMAATIQFNKARGVHQVDLDADVVRALIQQGMSDEEVASKLGMELDSVHRYKQLTGIADLFKNVQYSTAWEMEEDDAD